MKISEIEEVTKQFPEHADVRKYVQQHAPATSIEEISPRRIMFTNNGKVVELRLGVGDGKWRVQYTFERDATGKYDVETMSSKLAGVEEALKYIDDDYSLTQFRQAVDVAGEGEDLDESSCGGTSSGSIATVNSPKGVQPKEGQFFGGNAASSIYGPIKANRRRRKKVVAESIISPAILKALGKLNPLKITVQNIAQVMQCDVKKAEQLAAALVRQNVFARNGDTFKLISADQPQYAGSLSWRTALEIYRDLPTDFDWETPKSKQKLFAEAKKRGCSDEEAWEVVEAVSKRAKTWGIS